jgi:hypothetical protein
MSGRKPAHKILTSLTFLIVLAALGCGTYSPVAPSQEMLLPGIEDPNFVRLLPASDKVSGLEIQATMVGFSLIRRLLSAFPWASWRRKLMDTPYSGTTKKQSYGRI